MAVSVTVDTPGPIALVERGRHFTAFLSERRMHAATMVPIASAFLAGLTGLFVDTGSAAGDRHLVLAGFRSREVLAGRLGVIGAATVLAVAVAVTVSGAWYLPRQWAVFAGANLLIALTYAMIGVLVGPLVGLGGLYLTLLFAFIDVGLGQSVMFPSGPPAWGAFLPARGASRVMIDGAFTGNFDQGRVAVARSSVASGSHRCRRRSAPPLDRVGHAQHIQIHAWSAQSRTLARRPWSLVTSDRGHSALTPTVPRLDAERTSIRLVKERETSTLQLAVIRAPLWDASLISANTSTIW